MSITITSERMRHELRRRHPVPLDMTILGLPGSLNPRRTTTLVSTARPSAKGSVGTLGLNYSLSSGGILNPSVIRGDSPLPPPLSKASDTPSSGFSPNLILKSSSHYTTTGPTARSRGESDPPRRPNLARLRTHNLFSPTTRQGPAGIMVRKLPPLPTSISPVTPPLLTPVPMRPVRRWGMMVFPQSNDIGHTSSVPQSPISFDDGPTSRTSIIAIKSPVERRDSRRISDTFSLLSPLMAPSSQEDVPPIPSIPATGAHHACSISPPTPRTPPPIPTPEVPVFDASAETSCYMSRIPTPGKESDQGDSAGSGSSIPDVEKKQPQTKTSPGFSFRRVGSHNRRASTNRRENSVRRPNRRPMPKRDSGVPFATAMEPVPQPALEETPGATKEGKRLLNRQRSLSRRLFRASTRRAKTTVVMMMRGRGKAEEKDVVAVLPELRVLKVPKKLRL